MLIIFFIIVIGFFKLVQEIVFEFSKPFIVLLPACDRYQLKSQHCTVENVLKSYSSALLISRYILRLGQRGRCCFCAACPNRKMYLEEIVTPKPNSFDFLHAENTGRCHRCA